MVELLDGVVEFELSELLLEDGLVLEFELSELLLELEDGLVLLWFELYVPPAAVAELLDGVELFELNVLLFEEVDVDGLLVLAEVLLVEL